MSSITNTSSYSASASKGFSGLVSGLDTEDMVTKLLSGTQAKIDKQNANKQVLAWKQSMYRDVVTSFNNFKNNFFSYTSKTNLLSSSFFNSMSSVSSSSAVKVTAGPSAPVGQLSIDKITRLASFHSEASASTVSGELAGQLDLTALSELAGPVILSLNLDGVQKNIDLDKILSEIELNPDQFTASLQTAINQAFGNGVKVENSGNILSFDTSDSRQVTLSGDSQVMAALGMKSGISNKMNLNMALKDINFKEQLQGSAFSFNINNVEIEATEEDTLGTLINRINSSEAGVKVSYSSLEDKFLITSTTSGEREAGYSIKLENQVGNVLTSLFGANSGNSVLGNPLTITDEDDQIINATLDTKLSDLGISGSIKIITGGEAEPLEINILETDTVNDLLGIFNTITSDKAELDFDQDSGKFMIMGVTIPMEIVGLDIAGEQAVDKLFGADSLKLNITSPSSGTVITEIGQNALLTINGIEVERNNNSFTIDGIQLELLETTDGTEPIVINTSRNTDQIYEGIKKFAEEYNALLDKLNGLIAEEPTYKSYAPLTSEQKKEMSEREVELWEEKAQEGLLRRDENITKALSEMRKALYSKPDDAKYALYNLGFDTGSWSDKGKLLIPPEPPAAFMEALANEPQEIENLFNNPTNGLAIQINQIIDNTAKVSSGSPGSIVRLAGAASLVDSNSSIGKQMEDIEDILDRLKNNYELEKNRYWKQFNSMEQMIAQMNQQSAWLAQQFSS